MIIFTRYFLFSCILCFLTASRTCAQEQLRPYGNPEEGFALMQQQADDKDYEAAIRTGRGLVEDHPGYFDAALYLARVYGWTRQYPEGYAIVDSVLKKEPGLQEAYRVRIDLAYWQNDWKKLMQYAEEALVYFPDDEKIRSRYQLARYQDALTMEAPELFAFYSYDHFKEPYVRRWHMVSAGANLPFSRGMFSPYLNAGFHAGGMDPPGDFQVNLESYITLSKTRYAMLGYGISPGRYFPAHHAALELWQTLPVGFALSAGGRYYYWERHFPFLTFSLEKYAGNYWFSLRNYLFFKNYGVSGSYYLSVRRYLQDKYNYLYITLGYGTAPDEPVVVVSDLDRLNASSFRAGVSKQIRYNIRLNISAGYAYEEYIDRTYRNRFDFKTGVYFRLK